MNKVRLMKFESYSSSEQLPKSADALFACFEKESTFFTREWFDNLAAKALTKDQHMLLACVVEEADVAEKERVLAILPLMRNESDSWYSLCTYYSALFTLLLTEDNQPEVLACLVQGLRQLPFDNLRLYPVAEDDRRIELLQQALESSGFTCHRNTRFYNWFHRTEGQSYANYMASRPGRVRNTIARKQRKLEREHGYKIRLYTRDDLSQAVVDYNTIYNASWKANEPVNDFIEGLALSLSTPGWLRLAILYIAGKPAAGQFWFVTQGKASIFRLAYDEAWKRYSPGTILTAYLMEHVIDIDKVEEIDFLTGDDNYKRDWMTQRRQRWSLKCMIKQKPKSKIDRFAGALRGVLKD